MEYTARENTDTADLYRSTLQVVAEMRKYQKKWFAGKKQPDLIESKRLEASVDMRLADLGIKAY